MFLFSNNLGGSDLYIIYCFNKQSCATCASSLAPSTVTSFLVPVLCLMNCPFASILAGAFYCLSEDKTPENQRDSGSLAFVI
jgi:hypothetical protein